MTSDDKQYRKRTRRLVISAAVALIAVGLIMFQTYSSYVERRVVEKCEAMTPTERKAAFIRSLVDLEARNAELSNRFASRGIYRVGLARGFDESQVESVIKASYENKQSFEDNFNITRLDITHGSDDKTFSNTDALVSYSTHDGSIANFYPIQNLSEVSAPEEIGLGISRSVLGQAKVTSERHIFRMKKISLVRDCCDNDRHSSESESEYLKRRLDAFEQTTKFFSDELNRRNLYVWVSSCGKPLTEDGENNMGTRRLKTFAMSEQTEMSK